MGEKVVEIRLSPRLGFEKRGRLFQLQVVARALLNSRKSSLTTLGVWEIFGLSKLGY